MTSYGSKSKTNAKKKKPSPIRVVVRCTWSNTRLNVPTTDTKNEPLPPIKLATKLMDLILRLESALPPELFQSSTASLVCLRKAVSQTDWHNTSLKQILDGDDGSGGIVLNLELNRASSGMQQPNLVNTAFASAASSLNIKPIAVQTLISNTTSTQQEPFQIDIPSNPPTGEKMTPDAAWCKVLHSNFDATTKDCLNTLIKIIDNLVSKPNEPRVRSIRCANAAFDRKVGKCKGGYEFLYSIGFLPRYTSFGLEDTPETLELTPDNESRELLLQGRQVLVQSAVGGLGLDADDLPTMPKAPDCMPTSMFVQQPARSSSSRGPTSGFNVYKTHSHNIQSAAMGAPDPYFDASSSMSTTERQLHQLQSKKDNLEREMQASIEADRGLVAYLPGDGPAAVQSISVVSAGSAGKGDSSLVAARMKRTEEERKKREEGGFTTQAMRDLEKMKKAKAYSHTQIRVNFADGAYLHAKFLPTEKVSTIRSIIQSSFHPSVAESLDFDLYVAPPRRLLDDTNTLNVEELVPAAKVHVSWKIGGVPASGSPGSYLRKELFSSGSTGTSFPAAKPLLMERKSAKSKQSNNATQSDGPSKEDLLMQRMLGKSTGLLGGKKSSARTEAKKSGGGPKWFKS